MTKKDYVLIAKAIKEAYGDNSPSLEGYALIRALGIAFANDNPRFDEVKFLKACGIGEPD